MSDGFFQSTISSIPRLLSPRCGICKLNKGCKSPKMAYTGKGRRKILVVAEAPGQTEDEQGTQLIGKSGQLLRKMLRKHGIDLDKDCWKTNAIICYPGKSKPTDKQIFYCRPNLMKAIRELNPETIILLGGSAVKSLIGELWQEQIGPISKWVGWKIPCQRLNAWICPTYHPSYLLRENNDVLDVVFSRHMKASTELKGRPWDEVPDYRNQIEVIMSPEEAADMLWNCRNSGGIIAFDYETNSLKPDADWAEIISCAVCWNGKETIAFPWQGEAVQAMSSLLRSDVKKIAANLKFEQRWTKAKLGHGVRNWYWDTMQAAHILDNRRGVTGLKFQAFVRLGQESYDDHIKPYFQSNGPGQPNRIRELDLRELLIYNGMDALLEYQLAMRQMEDVK